MTLVEEKPDQEGSSTTILICNIVRSYNLDSSEEELVEEGRTCSHCQNFLRSYCPKKGISVSPRYHCNDIEPKEKN